MMANVTTAAYFKEIRNRQVPTVGFGNSQTCLPSRYPPSAPISLPAPSEGNDSGRYQGDIGRKSTIRVNKLLPSVIPRNDVVVRSSHASAWLSAGPSPPVTPRIRTRGKSAASVSPHLPRQLKIGPHTCTTGERADLALCDWRPIRAAKSLCRRPSLPLLPAEGRVNASECCRGALIEQLRVDLHEDLQAVPSPLGNLRRVDACR
jgi:hypothetical protein